MPIDDVEFNPENPRGPIEAADVEMLAESLKSDGLLAPIGETAASTRDRNCASVTASSAEIAGSLVNFSHFARE